MPKADQTPNYQAAVSERGIFQSRTVLVLSFSLASAGCGLSGFDQWRYDNRQVRTIQASGLSRFGDRPVAGESIRDFFKNKIGLITKKGSPVPLGRAVPISRDGYYLTAWHVVDEDDFRLSDTVVLKPLPKSGSFTTKDYFRLDEHPGRIVWRDKSADLAIVKFDFEPTAVFRAHGPPLEKREAVFSGASGRNSGTLFAMEGTNGVFDPNAGVGNGPFQTAGTVTSVRAVDGGWIYGATLVSRGGMSGAAVVDGDGRLVGIIAAIQPSLFGNPGTLFSMLEPKILEEIVSEDRTKRRGSGL